MVDIFDEVSEDLRHERAVNLAKRYGGLLLLAAILVLVGVGGQQFWQARKARLANQAATQYLALTQTMDQPQGQLTAGAADAAAQKLVDFSKSAPEIYKTMARLRAASLYANAGELPKAALLWSRVGADEAAPQLMRDAASLLFAQHEIGIDNNADILGRLQPIVQESNPFHGLAREMQAMVYLNEGNIAMAKSLFTQVQDDPNTPQGAQNRAQAMLAKLNG
ncbi:MAG: tetratricopeptide repeat protein [Rhodospirillales bacterium]|nr:tetratricopeptide repeat protein [Rhodospirillales bacterium]